MINEQDNFLWYKMNAITRLLMVHVMSARLPLYIVNEYPKSGGSWLAQMLAHAMDLPFPRNRLPVFESCIMHGHYIRPGNMKNLVIMWRDGRDVIVSQYYHSLFNNEKGNARMVKVSRRRLGFENYDDIRNNLCDFIKYTYVDKISPKFSWVDFVRVWSEKPNVVHVKYEELLLNPSAELQRIFHELTGKDIELNQAKEITDKYSFERQSGRKPGQVSLGSFMRKGIVGDWKNHFTPKAKKLFNQCAGDALIQLGYEKDHSWTNE